MNAVLGWARLLASRKLDDAQTAKAVAGIERAAWAQARLIEDLLDLSCIVSGKLRINPIAIRIQPVIESAVDSVRPAAAAKHITLGVTLDEQIGFMIGDPDRIRQIVWNLVSNAIKFTPPGGRVDVRLTMSRDDVIIGVQDTGIGFGTRVATHLFQRFHQGDGTPTQKTRWPGAGPQYRAPSGGAARRHGHWLECRRERRFRCSRCGCRWSWLNPRGLSSGARWSGGGFRLPWCRQPSRKAPTPELVAP